MEWYNEIVGMTAVNFEDGKKIGSVRDIAFDPQSGKVDGLILENGSLFNSTCILPLSKVVSVLKDCVVVNSSSKPVPGLGRIPAQRNDDARSGRGMSAASGTQADDQGEASKGPKNGMKQKNAGKSRLAEKKVCSGSGQEIGIVKDFLFDMETGTIEGFELSDGIFEDLMRGRRLLPLMGKVVYGSDRIIVANNDIDEILDTGGGITKTNHKEDSQRGITKTNHNRMEE